MSGFKTCFFMLIVCSFIGIYQCGKYGGGSRSGGGSSGGSRSRPSPPSYGWKPSPSYTPSRRPSPTNSPSHRPPSSPRPSWDRSTSRPGPTPPPYNRPTSFRPGTTRRPQTTPRQYIGSTKSPTWNSLPPRPGSKDFKPQGPQGYQGPQKVTYKIKNKYYSYPGQYSLPMPSHHVGYYQTPSYHYSSSDTGSTALGFFLGYGLARLTTPTYSHYSFYDGYRPRYDHYNVHHYYHNKESVPQQQEIRSNNIVGCIADSATICPGNTVSLCTSSGTLMCVINAASTVPCADNQKVNCVRSTINCTNNTAEECKNGGTATINIPCVSTAKIYGDIKYENNTIVTLNNITSTNSTNAANATIVNNNTIITTTPEYSTKYPITTTPVPLSEQTATSTTSRKKREVPQNFCVAVLAVPAEKPPTEGEIIYEDAKEILSTFWETAWGV